MGISIRPKSLLGRWSVGLGAAFILVFVLSGVLTALGGVGMGPAPVGPIVGVALGVDYAANRIKRWCVLCEPRLVVQLSNTITTK